MVLIKCNARAAFSILCLYHTLSNIVFRIYCFKDNAFEESFILKKSFIFSKSEHKTCFGTLEFPTGQRSCFPTNSGIWTMKLLLICPKSTWLLVPSEVYSRAKDGVGIVKKSRFGSFPEDQSKSQQRA